jgi:hypothetical protein
VNLRAGVDVVAKHEIPAAAWYRNPVFQSELPRLPNDRTELKELFKDAWCISNKDFGTSGM